MTWYQRGERAGECPACGEPKLHASWARERDISPDWWTIAAPAVFRMHTCQNCQAEWVSVHLLLTPEEMVRQGIWP